jgi:hypothetical protein
VDALRGQAAAASGEALKHLSNVPRRTRACGGPNAATQKSASARWILMIKAIGFGDLKQAVADSNSKESYHVKCRIVSVALTSDQRRDTLSTVDVNQRPRSALADPLQPRAKSQAIQGFGQLPLRVLAGQGPANACSVASASAATSR